MRNAVIRVQLESAEDSDELLTRVAWMYYCEDMTQEAIGERLGLTRSKVNRLIAQARRSGMVKVQIDSPHAEQAALERALEQRFGVLRAHVCQSEPELDACIRSVGVMTASVLPRHLVPGQGLAVGWGPTLATVSRHLPRRAVPGLRVYAIAGGLVRSTDTNPFVVTSRIAETLSAEAYYINAPFLVPDARTRRSLVALPDLAEVYAAIARCDMLLFSIGSIEPSATIFRLNVLEDDHRQSLRDAGAVGDVFGYFVDAGGRPVKHPHNERVLAPALADLARIPTRILAAGGPDKPAIMRTVLDARLATILITDVHCARAVL
jgi:DNA-binding transcriptional regulator LsrR (DeoR family)